MTVSAIIMSTPVVWESPDSGLGRVKLFEVCSSLDKFAGTFLALAPRSVSSPDYVAGM